MDIIDGSGNWNLSAMENINVIQSLLTQNLPVRVILGDSIAIISPMNPCPEWVMLLAKMVTYRKVLNRQKNRRKHTPCNICGIYVDFAITYNFQGLGELIECNVCKACEKEVSREYNYTGKCVWFTYYSKIIISDTTSTDINMLSKRVARSHWRSIVSYGHYGLTAFRVKCAICNCDYVEYYTICDECMRLSDEIAFKNVYKFWLCAQYNNSLITDITGYIRQLFYCL